jgi:hypothetical protein
MKLKATETELCQRGLNHNIDGGEKGKKKEKNPASSCRQIFATWADFYSIC